MTCIYRYSYWESDEFYELILHSLSAIQVPLHFFGAYIIIMKTPEEMKKIKLSMLTVHLTCAFYDIFVTILTVPVFVFPICSGYPLGILYKLGVPNEVQIYIGLTLLGLLGPAVIMFFENRYNYLVRIDSTKKLKRVIHFFINYLIGFLVFAPPFFNVPDQREARAIAIQKLPCLPSKIVDDPKFFMLGNVRLMTVCALTFIVFVWIQAIFLSVKTASYVFHTKSISERTSNLQKKLFKAMCLQIVVPFVIILIPAIYLLSTLITENFDILFTNLAVVLITTHGLFSTIIMLIVHKPYRIETLKLLKCKGNHQKNIFRIFQQSRARVYS